MPYTSGGSTDAASSHQKGAGTYGRARCARVREGSFEGVPHDGLVELTGDEVNASRERWSTGSHEEVDANDPTFGAVVLQVEAHHREALLLLAQRSVELHAGDHGLQCPVFCVARMGWDGQGFDLEVHLKRVLVEQDHATTSAVTRATVHSVSSWRAMTCQAPAMWAAMAPRVHLSTGTQTSTTGGAALPDQGQVVAEVYAATRNWE